VTRYPDRQSMAKDQIKRFDRWRQRLPKNTAYLVALVINEIVPVFQERGFDRFPDYAGACTFAVGPNCIPLQRRTGLEWPTVEILFDKRSRPTLGVHFAMLPDVCLRHTENGSKEIPRLEANVVEGPAFFSLCKGRRNNFDCNFGCPGFTLLPKRKLDGEIATLKSLLPWLFSVMESQIIESWYKKQPGYVEQHALLSRASNIFRNG
jgi:hypothetical protein